MRFTKQIISIQSTVLFILIACSAPTARAKSVYAIIYHQNDIIGAYKIDANQIEYQKEIQAPQHEIRAIDLAIDSGSSCIFVTYEGSNIIEIMNAKTLEHEGSVTATGASNLAGIVFDEARQKLYTVYRGTNKLFVYFWNPNTKTLTPDGINPKILADLTDAHGIALDTTNNHLYVADRTNIVHYYDTDDWNDVNSVNIGEIAVDVDIDSDRGYLYAGGYTYHDYLLKLDLSTGIAEANDIGEGVIGLAVDPNSGLIYTTTYHNQLRVYDTSTSPFTLTDYEDIIKGCGVCVPTADVSYKPPAFYLEKVDVNEPNCVFPGDYITYKITYGPNGIDHNNVVITDYLPCQVDYINPFDPNYDDVNHTYKWQIGSLSASAPNDFVTLTVYVNLGVEPNGIITNYCEIESDNYFSFAFEDTNVCFWSPDIIYVDKDAVGCNSGLSWYHADPDLQSALQKAQAWDCKQIWVAEGIYKPTNSSDRLISFELLDGITIYGGFPPGGGTLFDRDPNAYETILSGDIGTPIDQNDNSYHVVKCEDVNNAILDGFTITAGNANSYYLYDPNRYGGGIYCKDSNDLMVTNCSFSGNLAIIGGGMYNEQSSPTLINCTFSGNSVTTTDGNTYGGAIFNWYYSNPNITNCTFSGNSATTTGQYSSYGGAICNWDYSDPNITNCVFNGNTSNATASNSTGGGVCNVRSSPTITNCVFSGNTANATSPSYYSWGGGIQDINSFSTVTNCIFSGNWADYGGGMESWDSSPIVTNCTFSGNSADYGGGMHNDNNSDPNVTNCTFSNNSAREGGAVHNYDHSDPNISNCVFNGNTADFYGGGMVNSNESSPKIINCTFSGNSTTVTGDYSHGGAMCNWIDSDANITNCTFSNNSAREGGAVYNYYSDPNIINCIFSGNTADVNGGGIYNYNSSSSMIRNSTFSNNSAYVGGAVCNYYSDPNISNCIFSGNTSDFFGGGMGNFYDSSPKITNCIFSGNSAGGYGGGGIGNAFQSPATITNCTFSGNYAYGGSYGGGGMCNWESSPMVTNCILWDNEAVTVYDEIYNYDANSDPNISYCDIEDSNGSGAKWGRKLGEDHGGNIDEDPCFFDVEQTTYSWTENASYDNSTFQSTLTDSGADWSVNQLAGKFVSPNTPQLLQFFIVSNDVNTIKVWSDVESIATSGDPYQIYDYHLKVESPCIDAGDPNGDYTGWKDIDGEPRVFDGDANETEIVDMGADEYYWSPADFDSDGLVNFFDYALLAGVWLINPTDQYTDVYDLIDNNRIDSNDLARFCEDWLWQTAWAKTFPFAYETMGRGMGKSMGEGLDFTQDLFPSVSAKQDQPELTAADIEEIIKWLQELWLTDDEVRKVINEDEWLEFIESVMQVLKQLIYN